MVFETMEYKAEPATDDLFISSFLCTNDYDNKTIFILLNIELDQDNHKLTNININYLRWFWFRLSLHE